MKPISSLLILGSLWLNLAGSLCEAASRFVEGTYAGDKRYDVKKVLEPDGSDSNLCWAASTSNNLQLWQDRLTAKGISIPSGVPDAGGDINENRLRSQAIFNIFSTHWPHVAFNATPAYQWYVQGTYESTYNEYITPDQITTGGGYWKDGSLSLTGISTYMRLGFDDHPETKSPDFLKNYLDLAIDSGWLISASVNNWSNHSINIWGYEFDESLNTLTGLWISDSDNPYTDSNFLVNLAWDSGYDWWKIGDAVFDEEAHARYEANPDAYDNLNGWYVVGLSTFYLGGSVPEPTTCSLFGLGIVLVSFVGRRRTDWK